MHTVRTRRLFREVCGPDSGSMTSVDRETVMPISLVLGIVVVVLLAGCQQFAEKTSAAAAAQPTPVVDSITYAHDNIWISQAHARAAKTGSDGALSDLSF